MHVRLRLALNLTELRKLINDGGCQIVLCLSCLNVRDLHRPMQGKNIKESGKSLLVECRILIFRIRNRTNDCGIRNPSSTESRYLEPGIRNPLLKIQNLRLSWIPLPRAICKYHILKQDEHQTDTRHANTILQPRVKDCGCPSYVFLV